MRPCTWLAWLALTACVPDPDGSVDTDTDTDTDTDAEAGYPDLPVEVCGDDPPIRPCADGECALDLVYETVRTEVQIAINGVPLTEPGVLGEIDLHTPDGRKIFVTAKNTGSGVAVDIEPRTYSVGFRGDGEWMTHTDENPAWEVKEDTVLDLDLETATLDARVTLTDEPEARFEIFASRYGLPIIGGPEFSAGDADLWALPYESSAFVSGAPIFLGTHELRDVTIVEYEGTRVPVEVDLRVEGEPIPDATEVRLWKELPSTSPAFGSQHYEQYRVWPDTAWMMFPGHYDGEVYVDGQTYRVGAFEIGDGTDNTLSVDLRSYPVWGTLTFAGGGQPAPAEGELLGWEIVFTQPAPFEDWEGRFQYAVQLSAGQSSFALDVPPGEYRVTLTRILDVGYDAHTRLAELVSVSEDGAELDIELDLIPVIVEPGYGPGAGATNAVLAEDPSGFRSYAPWLGDRAVLFLQRGVDYTVFAGDGTFGGVAMVAQDVRPGDPGPLLLPSVLPMEGTLQVSGDAVPPQLGLVDRRVPDHTIWLYPDDGVAPPQYRTVVPRGIYDVLLPHPGESGDPLVVRGQVAARCVVIE